MLDERGVSEIIGAMWRLRLTERGRMDRISGYHNGLRGVPAVPEGASAEVKEIARLSVKNVLGLVVDSFAQNLSVIGYRDALAQENDPAWSMWQRNRMDARQALVHVPALTYGAAYVTVVRSDAGPVINPRSPKQILTAYDDPVGDEWPEFAMEIWTTEPAGEQRRRGRLYDDEYYYDLDLGPVLGVETSSATSPISARMVGDPVAHGATYGGRDVCPVVRFVNGRDADGEIVGEVAPLIRDQQAINHVAMDRMLVSRFGARPQWVITGWTAARNAILKAAASQILTFDDPDVKAQSLPPAAMEPYNSVLDEMIQHVAMRAQISPSQVTGKMVNVSAEALAAAEANQQRKLQAKRDSFGESWEQVLRLAAEMDGDPATAGDSAAEVVWRDTEARAFGAVVDGVTKLAAAGVPIEELVSLVPGMTQQQVKGIRDRMRAGAAGSLVDRLLAQPAAPVPPAPETAVADAAAEVDGAASSP
ncbi:MAG: phage portal protein [Gordonia sp. (in: high G+C Gram-positive bacteria)]